MTRTLTLVAAGIAAGAIVLGGSLARDASGALPPDAYRQLQAEAPEAVEIQTVSVEVRRSSLKGQHGLDYVRRDVFVVARIQSIIRSAVGFKPGDTIHISYSIGEPMPGPGYPIELQPEHRYVAYMRCQRVVECVPVAYSASFVLPEQKRP